MSYTIDRMIAGGSFEEAESRTRTALAERGFGVLTEIDVAATMKARLGHDMAAYKILGACNPLLAWGAIGVEPKVGAMLPCNVIVRSVDGGTEVSAIDPVASMSAIENPELHKVAAKVRQMLSEVIEEI